MSSASKGEDAYPNLPSSLNAGDHEMRDYSTDNPEYLPAAHTAPSYTPYLGLRARLSQVWINKWTILLLLVLVRVLLAVKNLNNDIASAKVEALSACTSVENVGSAMASMPHYLSQGVNSLAADGVTKSVRGLMEMLQLTVSGIEALVLFIINMYISTYVCLIQLVISGSLQAAIKMIEDTGALMNKTIASITSDLSGDVSTFENGFNKFLSGLSGAFSGIGGSSSAAPKLDLSKQISELTSIQVDPTQLDSQLDTLSKNIPTFEQVMNFTNSLISTPFDIIKDEINKSMTFTFDKSIFPVADKTALTFCSDNDGINDFFDGLTHVADIARKVFIVVITLLAIIACVPMAYREIWRWRTQQQRALLLQKHAFDPMDVVYIASRPYTTTAGIKAASRFKSSKRQILTRWFIAYATSIPALFVLMLGVTGLFSSLCQYILLKAVEKEVPALTSEVSGFADKVVSSLENASKTWAADANGVISSTNSDINKNLLGWAVNGTQAMNDTLNGFMGQINNAINETFGGTILYEPVQGTIKCLLGLKVDSIEKGLTWVHDHAHVDFPLFPNDTLSLGAAASISNSSSVDSFLSSPGSVASDDITAAIVKLTNKMEEGISNEAMIAGFLVGIWVLIALIGLTCALIGMFGRDKTRAEGGPSYTGENRGPTSLRSPDRNTGFFPRFNGPTSARPLDNEAVNDSWAADEQGFPNEKLGHAGQRAVDNVVKRGHERTSSYGHVVGNRF